MIFSKAEKIRQNLAAITIQRYARGWIRRVKYQSIRRTILRIQTYGRGYLSRKSFADALNHYKAIQIQRFCRGYLARKASKQKLRKIIVCQSAIRRFLARRLFKKLKVRKHLPINQCLIKLFSKYTQAEAKTILHIKKKYKGLENKIISLQQRIDELNKEKLALKQETSIIPALKSQLEAMRILEGKLKRLQTELVEEKGTMLTVTKQLEMERDEKMTLLEEKVKIEENWKTKSEIWRIENDELKKQCHEMIEMAKNEDRSKYCC